MNEDQDVIFEVLMTILIIVTFLGFIFFCAWMYPTMTTVRQMNCAMVEFSPDMSLEVKQACREARSKK